MRWENQRSLKPIGIVQVPGLRDNLDAYQFDRFTFAHKPIDGGVFLRPCLRFELFAGIFDELSKGDKSLHLVVEETEPGVLIKEVVVLLQSNRLENRIRVTDSIGVIGQMVNQFDDLHTVFWYKNDVYKSVLPFCSVGSTRFGL